MSERRSKRAKITRGHDDYLPGNITEIELNNFMTFDSLKCKPGPRLNLVIGPNGSGKSSIVCAIALGLGGEPQLLGRATSVGAYVKRGEEAGYVKISLKGETETEQIIITRKINTSNKSEWLSNGRVVPKKDIVEIIQRFNIQVNNLTQFLPQDRVCEFAKLTPVQLLEETEKAVGDPQLPILHQTLVEKSDELKNIKRAIAQNGDTVNKLKALNKELEKDVERVRQREELLSKADTMKKKMPWLKYDVKKAEYMEAKKEEKDAKKKLDDAAKSLNDFKEPIEKQKREKAKVDSQCKKFSQMMKQNAEERSVALDKESNLSVDVRGKHNEMEELKKNEEKRQQKILKAKEDLAIAEQDLANLPHYEIPKDELGNLGSKIADLRVSVNHTRLQKTEKETILKQKKNTLMQCTDRLKEMDNRNNKLLQLLKKSGAGSIFEAYHWLQQHRHEFNKDVYGPALLEVNVSNRLHANYLEGHVPQYIWKSFITQDPDDRDFLVKNLKSFNIPILNYIVDEHRHKRPFEISEQKMKALGIYSRLDQVFDAPEAVKEVLIGQFGLDQSYIGSKKTDEKGDKVAELGISDFWTPENHYRWSGSRYGNHKSASVESLPVTLDLDADSGEIEELRSREEELHRDVIDMEEYLKMLVAEQRQLEDEAAKLEKQREEIIAIGTHERKKRKEIVNRVSQRKSKLEQLEQEEDLDTGMAKLIEQAAKLNRRRSQCAIHIKDLLVQAVGYNWRYAEKHLASLEHEAKIKEFDIGLKEHEKLAQQASLHLEYCKKEVEERKQQLLVAKSQAESIAVITPELEREFLQMPTTIEDLEAAIQDNISQANSILFVNQNILEEYEHRREKIDSLSKKLETDESELKNCITEIDSLKENWLPKLRSLVAQINETFGRNFQEMAVAGEVSLDEHDMDFNQFGILIKVKFRQAGQLQVLSAHHQSGGERSVSTILYLVSLQDLTFCPFRVVDEINQGMDPINERKMFQQLVRAASQPNTPQCFLLTPKLLPDLEYSEACTILNIMNGPWIDQPSKAWSCGERWGVVNGLAQQSG
ncbi:hypothetical protein ACFE04_010713 [Oxalis oulophora]